MWNFDSSILTFFISKHLKWFCVTLYKRSLLYLLFHFRQQNKFLGTFLCQAQKLFSKKFFDSIVQDKFSNMFLRRVLPFRHGFTQAWWICIPRWCMGWTAIHERGCDWCKLFPEISWYKKLAFLSSSVSFYDYLKWILKTTFERHQINLFLTFPLFFAE